MPALQLVLWRQLLFWLESLRSAHTKWRPGEFMLNLIIMFSGPEVQK
jgi:hypothetical protein